MFYIATIGGFVLKRTFSLAVITALLLCFFCAVPAAAAPRLYSEHIYLDAGFTPWLDTQDLSQTKYGGYLDLYFPFDKEMNLYFWFKAFYEGDIAPIEAVSQIGIQIAFNEYVGLHFGALYGFNNANFLAVDPEIGLIARLPVGKYVEFFARGGASYYFHPLGFQWSNFTVHYAANMNISTDSVLSFNVGAYGFYQIGSDFMFPTLQAGLGFRLQ